jgi:hypothetical protein
VSLQPTEERGFKLYAVTDALLPTLDLAQIERTARGL